MGVTLDIQTWGGLGDILREISLLPLSTLHSRFGVASRIWHFPPRSAHFHPQASCPDASLVRSLVSRMPFGEWGGESRAPRFGKQISRLVRLMIELAPRGRSLFPPGFVWTEEDALPEVFHEDGPHLILQTHLEGLPSKKWAPDRWRETIRHIRHQHRETHIHVLDPHGGQLAMEGVHVHDSLSVTQAIRAVSGADAVVSVDSWSKYVAAWHRIPQLILIPDQTPDYAHLTASTIWHHSYRGLQAAPEIRLLGLRPHSPRRASFTLPSLDQLSSGELARNIDSLLA